MMMMTVADLITSENMLNFGYQWKLLIIGLG